MQTTMCNEVYAIAYAGNELSELSIHLNDVPIVSHYKSSAPGYIPPKFLLAQGNQLKAKVACEAIFDKPKAEIEFFKGFQGEFPQPLGRNSNVLVNFTFDSAGEKIANFNLDNLPNYSYLAAPKTTPCGLLETIDDMRELASILDIESYLSFFEPMFKDLELGYTPPSQYLKKMLVDSLTENYQLVKTGELTIRSILDGKIFEVTDINGNPPIQFESTATEKHFPQQMHHAKYWIKYQGSWKVLRQ